MTNPGKPVHNPEDDRSINSDSSVGLWHSAFLPMSLRVPVKLQDYDWCSGPGLARVSCWMFGEGAH